MEHALKQRYLDQVLSDSVLVPVGDFVYMIFHPDHNLRGLSVPVYSHAMAESLSQGVMCESELLDTYIEMGVWPESKERQISLLQSELHEQKRALLDFILNTTALKNRKLRLRQLERALCDLLGQKQILLQESVEAHAVSAQQRFLIGSTTTCDGVPVWPMPRDFEKETDLQLVHVLCTTYFVDSILSSTIIRELARSSPWRDLWGTGKQWPAIFGVPIRDLGANQIDLVRWSLIYDSVFGSYERPDSRVVDDDDLLDSWLIRQSEQQDSRSKTNMLEKKVGGRTGNSDKSEVFVVTDFAGAQDVYAANDAGARREVARRQQQLVGAGAVKETDFTDSQNLLRAKAREQRSGRKGITSR